jgi:hypothetical protein
LNYLTEEMDVDPLLANIGYAAVGSLLDATFSPTTPGDDRNIMEKVFDTFTGNALTMLGYNPKPQMYDQKYWDLDTTTGTSVFNEGRYNSALTQYSWQESAYAGQIQDFTNIMRNQGIEAALYTYAIGLFNSTAVSTIANVAGIAIDNIGTYFKTEIEKFKLNPSSTQNVTVEDIDENTKKYSVMVRDEETGEMVLKAEFKEAYDEIMGEYFYFEGYEDNNGFKAEGDWGIDANGKGGLRSGALYEVFGNTELFYEILENADGASSPYKVTLVDLETNEYTEINLSNQATFADELNLDFDSMYEDYYMDEYGNNDNFNFLYDKHYKIEYGLINNENKQPEFTYYYLDGAPIASMEVTDYEKFNLGFTNDVVDNGLEITRLYDKSGNLTYISYKFYEDVQIVDQVYVNPFLGEGEIIEIGTQGDNSLIYQNGRVYLVPRDLRDEFNIVVPNNISLIGRKADLNEFEGKILEMYENDQDIVEDLDVIDRMFSNDRSGDGVADELLSKELTFWEQSVDNQESEDVPIQRSSKQRSFLYFQDGNTENTEHYLKTGFGTSDSEYFNIKAKENGLTWSAGNSTLSEVEGSFSVLSASGGGSETDKVEFDRGIRFSSSYSIGEGLKTRKIHTTYTYIDISEEGSDKNTFMVMANYKIDGESIGYESVEKITVKKLDFETEQEGVFNQNFNMFQNGNYSAIEAIDSIVNFSNSFPKTDNSWYNSIIEQSFEDSLEALSGLNN